MPLPLLPLRCLRSGWPTVRLCLRGVHSSLITKSIENRLQEIKQQHQALGNKLASPALSVEELTSASRTYANLERTVSVLTERDSAQRAIAEIDSMIHQEVNKY